MEDIDQERQLRSFELDPWSRLRWDTQQRTCPVLWGFYGGNGKGGVMGSFKVVKVLLSRV